MRKDEFYDIVSKDRLGEIVKQAKTPSYIYFKKIIEKKYGLLKSCLPGKFEINYAFKANPNREILGFIQSMGAGADVGSIGELNLALESGFAPGKIEFTGPGKTSEELEAAIRSGISSINAESISEIKKICRLCGDLKRKACVGLRLNPRNRSKASAIKMNENTQFGIIEDEIGEAFEILGQNRDIVDFTGFHLHLGSQMMKTEGLLSNFRFVLEKVYEIKKAFDLQVGKINFGGGWGIDMFGKESALDFQALEQGLAELFSDHEYKAAFRNSRFIAEPGRFLVAECGLYATPVIYRKRGYKKEFLIVDGGMHHHFAATGGVGQIIKRNYEIDVLSDSGKTCENMKYTVAGSLCLPADLLASNIELNADIAEGDVLVFFNSGAYALSASPVMFLGHPLPNELLI